MRVNVSHRLLAGLVSALAALALVACSGSTSTSANQSANPSTAPVSTEHNNADITFAQGMITHHRQAVEMADLAIKRAQNPEVKKLAEQIKNAQDPEIQQMLGFLKTWGAQPPPEPMSGMDMGGPQGTGMMTAQQMQQLQNAIGTQFDKLFLQGMMAHHQGAVTDSKRELAEGSNPQAKQLATQIIAAQSAEITKMQQLLASG